MKYEEKVYNAVRRGLGVHTNLLSGEKTLGIELEGEVIDRIVNEVVQLNGFLSLNIEEEIIKIYDTCRDGKQKLVILTSLYDMRLKSNDFKE